MEDELLTDVKIEELDKVESELQTAKKFDYKELGIWIFFILGYAFYFGLLDIFNITSHQSDSGYNSFIGILWFLFYSIPGSSFNILALIIIGLTERKVGLKNWLKRCLKFNFKFYWYLIPLFMPIVAYAIPTLFIYVSGNFTTTPYTADFWSFFKFHAFASASTIFLEEPSWRGYATHTMNEKRHPLVTGVIVGIVWAVSHLPAYYYGGRPWYTFPQFIFTVTIITCIYNWMYINTGSIIPGLIFHFMHNITNALFIQIGLPIYGGLVYLVILGAILLIFGPKLKRSSESSLKEVNSLA